MKTYVYLFSGGIRRRVIPRPDRIFTSLASYKGQLFASNLYKIFVFDKYPNQETVLKKIDLQCWAQFWNSIRVLHDNIYVCSCASNKLGVFSTDGDLKTQYEMKGIKSHDSCLSVWDASWGLLLLTDQMKNQLYIMKPDSNAKQLKLNRVIAQPSAAVLINDSLIVYSVAENNLFQFSIEH